MPSQPPESNIPPPIPGTAYPAGYPSGNPWPAFGPYPLLEILKGICFLFRMVFWYGGGNSVPVSIIGGSAGAGTGIAQPQGAKNTAFGGFTTSNSAQKISVAKPTRTGLKITNNDTTNGVFVGLSNVADDTTGDFIPPNQFAIYTTPAQYYVIAAAGTPQVTFCDEWN